MPPKTLFEWCGTLPKWQQDAVRRLAVSPTLSDADITEVLANLKQENGIEQDEDLACTPVSEEHLKPAGKEQPKTLLCSLEPVEHVNRLANGQVLPFGIDGITIVYGHNGAGKSGYARIAKKLCRAKVVDGILPNVFEQGMGRKAKVNVRYKVEGETDVNSVVWQDGEGGPDAVAHISVFDSANARLYVDDNSQIDYLPYELEILERLAALLSHLREHIDGELRVIEPQLRVIGIEPMEGTAVASLVGKLTLDTPIASLPSEKDIRSLADWTESHAAELNTLNLEVKNDPAVVQAKNVRITGALDTISKRLNSVGDTLQGKNIEVIETAFKAQKDAENVAKMAAAEMFKEYPLGDIGSDPWRQMFEYAKAYSKEVYPDVSPPATRPGDNCVLCQQPLAEDARQRLDQFEAFVSGKAQADLDKTRGVLQGHISTLKELVVPTASEIRAALAELLDEGSHRKGFVETLDAYVAGATNRLEAIIKSCETGDFDSIPELNAEPIKSLSKVLEAYRNQVKAAEVKNAEATQLAVRIQKSRQKRDQLQDRHLLNKNIDHVIALRNNLETYARLQTCSKALDTSSVSRQVNALRTELVTDELRARIQDEIDYLGLSYLPITLKERSKKGESLVGVSLGSKVSTSNSNVLSEGEQRGLALACFLADINGQPTQHGIIIDDPVSSLDHLRIRKFARRLVDEAATGRQVIVFTHSLQFFSDVLDEAASRTKPVKVVTHHLRTSKEQGFGVVYTGDRPWEAMPVTARIEHLRTKLKALEGVDTGAPQYRDKVVDFYTDLRESWERLVEEVLFSKTVERFGPPVRTQSLRGVMVDDEDYKTIYWGMTRASEYSGHDRAAAKEITLPGIDEMKEELRTIEEYRAKIKKRTRTVGDQRKKLEVPETATIL